MRASQHFSISMVLSCVPLTAWATMIRVPIDTPKVWFFATLAPVLLLLCL